MPPGMLHHSINLLLVNTAVCSACYVLQCRQKTVEVKAKCTDCTLYWCPRCLTNRYGEVVEEVGFISHPLSMLNHSILSARCDQGQFFCRSRG